MTFNLCFLLSRGVQLGSWASDGHVCEASLPRIRGTVPKGAPESRGRMVRARGAGEAVLGGTLESGAWWDGGASPLTGWGFRPSFYWREKILSANQIRGGSQKRRDSTCFSTGCWGRGGGGGGWLSLAVHSWPRPHSHCPFGSSVIFSATTVNCYSLRQAG